MRTLARQDGAGVRVGKPGPGALGGQGPAGARQGAAAGHSPVRALACGQRVGDLSEQEVGLLVVGGDGDRLPYGPVVPGLLVVFVDFLDEEVLEDGEVEL